MSFAVTADKSEMDSDNDSDIGDMLDDLLANADDPEARDPPSKKTLQELNYNFLDSQENISPSLDSKLQDDGGASLVHERDVDSSDDEDKRNFESQNYSDYGRNLKDLLKKEYSPTLPKPSPKYDKPLEKAAAARIENSSNSSLITSKQKTDVAPSKSKDVYGDPVFGLRLIKPLISSAELVERMRGRTPVTVSRVKGHIATGNANNDWVIAGVVINRSTTKTSQKGSQYCIWKLSDLSEKMSTVSLFLFSDAYKAFWKTTTGTAIGILNPNVLESKDDTDQATLSVDNKQKVMILGNSRDMAKCKSSKKNGEPCSNIVNLSRCEYCVYHVKQEYDKASRRADIQSNASGRGFSSSLAPKAKVPLAGMYSQGNQNFTAIPAKRNQKLYEKDSARLALLKGATVLPERAVKIENFVNDKKKAAAVELTTNQVKKDLERLNKLRGWNIGKQQMNPASPSEASTLNSPTSRSSTIKTQTNDEAPIFPQNSTRPSLNAGVQSGTIDFSAPITKNSSSPSRKSQTSRVPSISSPNLPVPRLGGGPRDDIIDISKPLTRNSNSPSQKFQTNRIASISSSSLPEPRLGGGLKGDIIDISEPVTKKHLSTARQNAIRYINKIGPLKQSNPNKIRESKEKKVEASVKRRREFDEAEEQTQRAAKKAANGIGDKFRKLLEVKSAHGDLVEKSQDEEKEKYFNKLEIKERMEEKMLTTFKIDCKTVRCFDCKYTAFSASEHCIKEKHKLRYSEGVKSFFKCADCGNRTVSLDRIPSRSCKKCSGSHWVRTSMMAEKKTGIAGAKLSIRGGEETFIGSVASDANIDLCVPDAGTGVS